MRKLFISISFLIAICLFTIIVPTSKLKASTEDFVINNFTSDFYINKNDQDTSTMEVEERITATFPNYNQNHGIYRAIPNRYQDHTLSLSDISVTNQYGVKQKYSKSNKKGLTVLKIGDKDKYVRGEHTYFIKYKIRNVINFQKLDEFYWDVNGTEWKQHINQVTSILHVPSSLSNQLQSDKLCYTGKQNSKEQNCTISTYSDLDETTITTKANNLSAGETLTVVSAFKKDTFKLGPEIAADEKMQKILFILTWPALFAPPILAFVVMYPKWLKYGRDPKGRGVIIPEYVAPKDLNLLQSSYVLSEQIKPEAYSAELIHLCIAGYLKISEIVKGKIFKSKDYEIEIVKNTDQLNTEQRDLLLGIFSGTLNIGTKINISSSASQMTSAMNKINEGVSERLGSLGYFVGNPKKVKEKNVIFLVISIFIGICCFWLFVPLAIGIILMGVIVQMFTYYMSARTQQGVAVREYLLGLKEYIKLAEADRIKYLQSPMGVEKKHVDGQDPKQQIKLFESLLPYAMLFKLEKEWAKQFKDLYTEPPNWYNGNFSTFNAVSLANSMSSFNDFNSSSSGFSGSGGAGGGGGGGGGGGW